MKFKKTFLQQLVGGEIEPSHAEVIEDKIIENSRWTILHDVIFKMNDTLKFYKTHYQVGATEMQDEGPYEYDDDEIECIEVKPVKQMITVYEPVKI